MADGDAFRSIGLDRRRALWEVSALSDSPAGIYKGKPSESVSEGETPLPQMSLSQHVVHDYCAISLSLKGHPVHFIREKLSLLRVKATKELTDNKDGEVVKVAAQNYARLMSTLYNSTPDKSDVGVRYTWSEKI